VLKGGGHAVVDERRAPYFSQSGGEQHPPGVCTHSIVGGAANQEIALFKGVRERKRSPEFLIVHDSATLSGKQGVG